jgi:hypothetical protein
MKTTVNETLESKIAELKAKNEKEINAEIFKFSAHEKTGIPLENIIVYSDNSFGFGWHDAITDKEQIKKIFEVFPINGTNYEMKFAGGSKNYTTDSPLIVKWNNSDSHYQKKFELHYTSGDVKIKIDVPVSHFGSHVYTRTRQGKHLGFGRYEQYRDVFIDYFYTQHYGGGYNTLYFLEGAESLKEYENFVITCEFKYESEID